MTSDGNKNYTYNTENQLVQVKTVSDGSTVATYEYDYRGLRISKTVSGVTTRFHYDDKERLVRESDTNNNTIAQYMYDDNNQLQAIEKGGQIYYTHYNYRGDIQGLTDATGQKIAWYSYTPWGEIRTSLTNDPINQSFRYAGYYYDSETGLYYLKARYYSPDLGRFVTKDTFKGFNENPQTLNLYAYANGNPVMNVDPTGHWGERKIAKVALKKLINLLKKMDFSRYSDVLTRNQIRTLNNGRNKITDSLSPLLYYSEIFDGMIRARITDLLIFEFGFRSSTASTIAYYISWLL